MVREITMFELHFDGAQFGPSSVGRSTDASETASPEDVDGSDSETEPETERRSVGRLVLASLAVSVAVSLFARRLARRRGARETDEDVPIEEGDALEEPAVQ